MWLRHALKLFYIQGSAWLMAVLGLLLLSSCQPSDKAAVDKLNDDSYAFHYVNIDSTEYYARQALKLSASYADGSAEALNNLAFVSIIRMNYTEAERQLNEATTLTDNQIELLVCYVQQMRLCQRRSHNKEFYDYRERAITCMKRINEERETLTGRQLLRLLYAETEYAIVNSTYYYYVGLERQSVEALFEINSDVIRHDTAQYLNFLYNMGAGGIITRGSPEEIHQQEIDCLDRCLSIASRFNYPYFEANAKEALADHLHDIALAGQALDIFTRYGDVYQIAGAHRTLASCYLEREDYSAALNHLEAALSDSLIYQAPDLVASIREQLSVTFSAINDKPGSDYNRNIYIDLQEQTRQDRELEARAANLDRAVQQLNWMISAVLGSIVLLLFLLWLFNRQNKKQQEDHLLDDLLEETNEQVTAARLRLEKNERRHLEQRAKVSLATGILPLIDRILHEVRRIDKNADNSERLDYIRELTDNINQQNDLLTQWIQLRQGELNLHIESFPLQQLFDIVARSKRSFAMKGLMLDVEPTDAIVKADRVLTLFMLNTLADNARKFTPRDGHVSISAQAQSDYVEISVSDTGCGMNQQQLAGVFNHKVQQGHGFGLMNCKGIIEKYRKISHIFSVCQLMAESEEGRGSRFFFRLPKGITRSLLLVVGCMLMAQSVYCMSSSSFTNRPEDLVHIYADSAYFCNVNGTYQRTLQFADSCLKYLNIQYVEQCPNGQQFMSVTGDTSVMPSEILWYHDSIDVNYQIVLDIRNEMAVAALALHEWSLYAYNNKVYTQLFKEMSADNTLADYCRAMQESQTNKRIAVILLLVLLVLIVPAYYMLYYRHRLHERFRRERMKQTSIELAGDELRRVELEDSNFHVANAVLDNCLSTLKHETMYYPSRIRQLVDAGDTDSLTEVTAYYRDLYGILIQQATDQMERIRLRIRPVTLYGQHVLGDADMLRYLFELLLAADGGRPNASVMPQGLRRDDKYVVFHIPIARQLSALTTYLARQIVRDHGEATHRRACGIQVADDEVVVTLPAAVV